MELKILDKKDNPLLHRLEVEAELVAEGPTPSNKDVAAELAKQLKADEKMIIVRHIYSRFGTNKADVLAYAYNDEAKMKEIEMIKEKPKAEGEAPADKKPAEAPVEPKPEASPKPAETPKPAEEKPEQKPAEEKTE